MCKILMFVLSSLLAVVTASAKETTVLVTEVTTRDRAKTELTKSLTREFEAALSQQGCYALLDTRDLAEFLAELERERQVYEIFELPAAELEILARRAEMIAFGEVFDDVGSGQVTVTIELKKFDRTKVLIERISIPRGKIQDASTRQEAMIWLARKICRTESPKPSRTRLTILRLDFHDVADDDENLDIDVRVRARGEEGQEIEELYRAVRDAYVEEASKRGGFLGSGKKIGWRENKNRFFSGAATIFDRFVERLEVEVDVHTLDGDGRQDWRPFRKTLEGPFEPTYDLVAPNGAWKLHLRVEKLN